MYLHQTDRQTHHYKIGLIHVARHLIFSEIADKYRTLVNNALTWKWFNFTIHSQQLRLSDRQQLERERERERWVREGYPARPADDDDEWSGFRQWRSHRTQQHATLQNDSLTLFSSLLISLPFPFSYPVRLSQKYSIKHIFLHSTDNHITFFTCLPLYTVIWCEIYIKMSVISVLTRWLGLHRRSQYSRHIETEMT